MNDSDRGAGHAAGPSGRTPGATRRPCSTRPPRSSSRRAWKRRYATSRPRPASGWARSTATSRPGRTSSSPSTGTRSTPAPRPGPALLASSATPHAALGRWIDLFVDFLVTKHGLAAVLQSDNAGFETLHAYFLDRLVPVCAQLLDAAAAAGEIRSDLERLRAHARRRQPLHRRGQRPPLRRTPTGRAPRRGTAPAALTTVGRAARPARAAPLDFLPRYFSPRYFSPRTAPARIQPSTASYWRRCSSALWRPETTVPSQPRGSRGGRRRGPWW